MKIVGQKTVPLLAIELVIGLAPRHREIIEEGGTNFRFSVPEEVFKRLNKGDRVVILCIPDEEESGKIRSSNHVLFLAKIFGGKLEELYQQSECGRWRDEYNKLARAE